MRTSVEKHFHTIEEAEQELDFPISQPGYMPEGFVLPLSFTPRVNSVRNFN